MTNNLKQSLRIIGGEWRSRKLNFPDMEGLRPTSARIRETLFNWLRPYVEGSTCLDLFAGSGALGLEALSRGAAEVTFVEAQQKAVMSLKQSLHSLDITGNQIFSQKAEDFLAQSTKPHFDIIFLDPPYGMFESNKLFALIDNHLDCKKRTLIFYEDNKPLTQPNLPSDWEIIKNKKAGNVFYYLLSTGAAFI